MVMNEETMRFMMGLNPRAWEVRCDDWKETYRNRSDEVAMLLNDWNGYRITHLSAPENGIIAVWLKEEEE